MLLSRRHWLASAALAVPALHAQPRTPLKVIVTGAHPGDPECGCGGTIARYSSLGHQVVLLYLNRGEGFCSTSDLSRCAGIRTREAQAACQLLNARAAFAGQIDGQAVVDGAHYDDFRRQLDSEKPDIVFAHWPIDDHRDHRALSLLVLDAWLTEGKAFALYYYEVAGDTRMFSPGEFVDISAPAVEQERRAACYAHTSQQPQKWYPQQETLTRFRGSQSGYSQAEGFLKHWQSRRGFLP